MRESYEQAFGIYDHKNAPRDDHLALVKHHWSEDSITSSRYRERLDAYLSNKVGTQLHMSFNEFISQPSYLCDLQLEVLSNRPDQNKELEELLAAMRKDQGK